MESVRFRRNCCYSLVFLIIGTVTVPLRVSAALFCRDSVYAVLFPVKLKEDSYCRGLLHI